MNEQSFVSFSHPEFVRKLLADPSMMAYFIRELDRISAPEYLAEIKDVLSQKSAESLDSLQTEFPSIGPVWDVVLARQEVLRKVVNPSIASVAYATREDVIPGRSSILLNVATFCGSVSGLLIISLAISNAMKPSLPGSEEIH